MKKLSISLLVMLLIASLFTSCSMGSDDASDVRVKVRLTPSGGGRSLNTDFETINLDDDNITWHYSAAKVSETQFNYGATSDSLLPKDGIVTLSQGEWKIKLWAYKDSKKVYDSDESNVTIKWNFYEPNVTVTVLVKQNTGDNGYIVLDNVTIPNGNTNVPPKYIYIDDTTITNFVKPYMKLEATPGTHTITFEYRNDENTVVSSKSVVVNVISGRETTISGNITKEELSTGGSTEVQAIEVKKDSKVEVITSIAPAQPSSSTEPQNKTTVTFPAGSFNADSANAVLNLSVKSAGEITVTSTEVPAVAGIDISLLVNNQPVTEFNGKEVVIETYIAKDLTNVSVKYNGAGDQPIATDDDTAADKTVAAVLTSSSPATDLGYNPSTGLLRFKTNHFSEYYVLADVEALNVSTGILYKELTTAIKEAKDGQKVKLMSNVNITSPIYVNKNLILDLNEKNITGTGTRIFNVTAGTLEISGTGILLSSNIAVNSSVIRVGSNENSTPLKAGLIVGQSVTISGPNSYGVTVFGSTTQETIEINGTITSYSGAVSGNGSSGYSGTKIIINEGASLSATNASGIYHPQAGDLIINGGSISGTTGIEIKSGNASVSVNGNPTITATGKIYHTASSNGNSSSGYSIAVVENRDYSGDASIVIESGTFTGPVALLTDSESTTKYSINIKGGLFSDNPSNFVALGYGAIKNEDEKYEVVPIQTAGYKVKDGNYYNMLPEKPIMNGDTWTINPENAQYTLDGAYGSINGKTIVFSSGTYPTIELARATKYAGSNTDYYIGRISAENEKTFEEFYAIKNSSTWSEPAYYVRNIEDVTLRAESGVVIPNIVASSGHVYGNVYDYVLDKAYTGGSAYYLSQNIADITIEGFNFTEKVEFATSSADTEINGITFKKCTFTTGGTESSNGEGLRYYNEANNGKVKNLVVDTCTFKNCFQGVYTQQINGVTVVNSTFDTTGHNAIAIQTGGPEGGPGYIVDHGQVVIIENKFINIGDRIIRFGNVGADTQITIKDNTATNSGDSKDEVIKAQSLEAGVTYNISGNNWGEGKTVANNEFKDK